MKPFRKIYSLILFSFACLLGLNACSSEEGTEPPQKEEQLVMAISYEPSEDLLAVADIKLTYTDGYGQKHTEAVKKKFEKSVTIVAFPINAGYEVSVTPKTSYEKKESYNIAVKERVNITRNGTPVKGLTNSVKLPGVTDIERLLRKGTLNKKTYFHFNAEGKFVAEPTDSI